MIRVLIVDDSAPVALLMEAMLHREPGLAVVGRAASGTEAIALTQRLRPDVITMDLNMPGMGGIEAIRRIMEELPTPIVVVSTAVDLPNSQDSFLALEAGAVAVFGAPPLPGYPRAEALARDLAELLRAMAGIKLITRRASSSSGLTTMPMSITQPTDLRADPADMPRLLAVAASTGGPQALVTVLRDLPASFPLPILVVQHISPGFVNGMVEWLDENIPLHAQVAREGEQIRAGTVYVAPDDRHLLVEQFGTRLMVRLDEGDPVARHRPSASPLFSSVAQTLGRRAIGLVLTGMGSDGAIGLLELYRHGSLTLAQDPRSCVIDSMPQAAIESGGVSEVVPLAHIARRLKQAAVTPVTAIGQSNFLGLDSTATTGSSGQYLDQGFRTAGSTGGKQS